MGMVLVQRLVCDDMTIEQTSPIDKPTMRAETFGIVHQYDSMTGKRGGDVDVYPWHRVQEFRTWRKVVRG